MHEMDILVYALEGVVSEADDETKEKVAKAREKAKELLVDDEATIGVFIEVIKAYKEMT